MSLPTCPKCGCQLEVKLTYASGPKKASMTPSMTAVSVAELLEQAELRDLNKWEQEFIESLRERFDQYGDRIRLSDKQQATLENIASGKNSR